MRLSEKAEAVISYLKSVGGKSTVADIANAIADGNQKSINAIVTTLGPKGKGKGKGFVDYKSVGEGEARIRLVKLTEAGMGFVPVDDAPINPEDVDF